MVAEAHEGETSRLGSIFLTAGFALLPPSPSTARGRVTLTGAPRIPTQNLDVSDVSDVSDVIAGRWRRRRSACGVAGSTDLAEHGESGGVSHQQQQRSQPSGHAQQPDQRDYERVGQGNGER